MTGISVSIDASPTKYPARDATLSEVVPTTDPKRAHG